MFISGGNRHLTCRFCKILFLNPPTIISFSKRKMKTLPPCFMESKKINHTNSPSQQIPCNDAPLRDGNRPGRPIGAYDRSGQVRLFSLIEKAWAFFLSLFSLKGQATGLSKSLLSLLGCPI